MKNTPLRLILFSVIACSLFQQTLAAQITATWKGGTPGRPNDWNCATNWRENRVPNEFSNVVLGEVATTSFAWPIVFAGDVQVNALCLAPNTWLTIGPAAQLTVLERVEGLPAAHVVVKGKMVLPQEKETVEMTAVARAQVKNY